MYALLSLDFFFFFFPFFSFFFFSFFFFSFYNSVTLPFPPLSCLLASVPACLPAICGGGGREVGGRKAEGRAGEWRASRGGGVLVTFALDERLHVSRGMGLAVCFWLERL